MRDILNSYTVSELKKEVSKYNKKVSIRGISKMTKSELVNEMMKHQDIFNYLKKKQKAPKPAPKPAPKKESKPAPAPKEDESYPLPLKKLTPDKIKKFIDFKNSIRNLHSLLFTKKNTELEVEPVIKKLVKKIISIDNSEQMKGKVQSALDTWFGDHRFKTPGLTREIRELIRRSDKNLNIF
jgi:hypothetical protein